jgi:membrane protein DedA with SNARE-associated domain
MKLLFEIWWKFILWLATIGIIVWFAVTPVLSIYGLARPWPEANEKLHHEGITGLPLMIGAGSDDQVRYEGSRESWRHEKQRTYIVLPDSLRRLEIFTFSEWTTSDSPGVKSAILRSPLILFVFLWLLAGWFSIWRIRNWRRKYTDRDKPSAIH